MKRVLFITTQDIFDSYGNGGVKGTQKNFHLIEQYFGKENVLLCLLSQKAENIQGNNIKAFKKVSSSIGALLAALCGCKAYFPWQEREIVNYIRDYNPDVLFIDSSTLGRMARINNIAAQTIVFYHNIEADYAWNKVKNEGLRFLPSYWASRYNDRCGCYADKVFCLNARDSNRLNELYGRKADFLIPVSFTDVFDENKTSDNYERSILFLGSYFAPNQLSIEWFIKEVMPKLDNISLDIVGKGFEQKKELYEKNKGVNVIGSVKELDKYYYSHAAVVLPIICGAGMKVKTAEAMMYGRTIFASDEALEGYDVEGVEGIIRCNTADEYVEAINGYFSQGKLPKYQMAVRERFLKKYETNVIGEGLNEFLDSLFYLLDYHKTI